MICFQIAEVLATWQNICSLLIVFRIITRIFSPFWQHVEKNSHKAFLTAFQVVLTFFMWHSRPPHGRSGGILGVKIDTIDVLACFDADFHVKLHIRNKSDNFTWSLVAVYGAAQKSLRLIFFEKWLT
jgi:hypothetical protein